MTLTDFLKVKDTIGSQMNDALQNKLLEEGVKQFQKYLRNGLMEGRKNATR